MEHLLEISPSGRATCRTCHQKIAKGELRFGEAVPSQFGSSGFATEWHHLTCAARKKPDLVRPLVASYDGEIPNRDALFVDAAPTASADSASASPDATPKGPKGVAGALPNADLAPTGRAKCMVCGEAIAKGSVRIAVEREIDTGSFSTTGAGYLHPACLEGWADEQGVPFEELLAQVQAHTALDALPPPLGEGAEAATEEPKAKGKKTKSEPKTAAKSGDAKSSASNVPAFAGLDAKALSALAGKLEKLFDPNGFKHDDLLEKSKVEWKDRGRMYFHLVEHDLLDPGKNAGVLSRMAENVHEGSTPAGLVKAIAKFPVALKPLYRDYGPVTLLPEWTVDMQRLAVEALAVAPDAVAALEKSAADPADSAKKLPPTVRRGLAFVRGLSGQPLTESERADVLDGLARAELSGYGLRHLRVWRVKDGEVFEGDELRTSDDLAKLAETFGDAEAWSAALEKHLPKSDWQTLEQAKLGLLRVPLDALMPTMLGEYRDVFSEIGVFFEILDRRADPDDALERVALRVFGEDDDTSHARSYELLRIYLLARKAARGERLPDALLDSLELDAFSSFYSDSRGAPFRERARVFLRGLEPERACALARRVGKETYTVSRTLPILEVHFDDTLFSEVLTRDVNGYLDPLGFAAIGVRAIPRLIASWQSADPKLKSARGAAIVRVLAAGEGTLSADETAAVEALGVAILDLREEESYWPPDRANAAKSALARLDEAARARLVLEALKESKRPERAFRFVELLDATARVEATKTMIARASTLTNDDHFDVGLRALGDDAPKIVAAALPEAGSAALMKRLEKSLGAHYAAFLASRGETKKTWLEALRAIAAEGPGEKERIYLLEPGWRMDDVKMSPRAGSFSRLGGAGPVGALVPKHAGEPLSHVLTIDLDEAPELRARLKTTARAVALYVPDPEGGEDYDASTLIMLDESATPATDGEPLFVLALDVPSAIFDSRAARKDASLGELRKAVFNRTGWALGEPMWIQEDEGSDRFVMQLSDATGLNLGDSGSLYVFDYGALMQCY